MLDAGLRVREVTRLKVSDLWFAEAPVNTLIVRAEIAKNHKERQIPLNERITTALRHLATTHWMHRSCHPSCYAFEAPRCGSPITTRQVERIILNAAHDAGIKRATPHMLRHTFATRVLAKSNTRVTQILLGHSSLQSTQIYTHPNNDDLRKAIE